MAAKNDGRCKILEPQGSRLKNMSIRWFTIVGEGKSEFHPAMSNSRGGLGLDSMGTILIGLDPGLLPAPEVASAMLGKTMTPGLNSGEAPNNDGKAGVGTLGVGDGPATGFGSRS
jgi:hypothetical protein